MKRMAAALACAAMGTALLLSPAVGPAAADPLAEKRVEAEKLAGELDRLGQQASMLTEDLNAARLEGIHHVGICVGNGQMIEAPETGKNVRYGSIYRRDLVGVGRVR